MKIRQFVTDHWEFDENQQPRSNWHDREYFIDELEKFITTLLEEQKRICKAHADHSYDDSGPEKVMESILSAPYPVETNLVVLDKEKLEEVRSALNWMWKNLSKEVHDNDAFNIPANAISILDEVLPLDPAMGEFGINLGKE